MSWVAAIRRKDITFDRISDSTRVCSLHFHSGKPAYEMCESHPDWAPSINLGHSEVKPSKPDRFARREKRQKTHTYTHTPDWCMQVKEDEEMNDTTTEVAITPKEEDIERVIVGGAEVVEEKKPMTQCEYCEGRCAEMNRLLEENKALKGDRTKECDFCGLRRTEINRLLEENRALKSELEKYKMEEQFLKDDNEKVKYYTGLPDFEFLMTLLTTVKPHLPQNLRVLSPFQMVFLTLIRLRLNLPLRHLLHLFRSSRKTALTAFGDTISALNAQFGHLVQWPERGVLQATLPQKFLEAFENRVAVMLDCFVISINGSPASAMKYLISVTPQGSITFISKGWNVSVSDEHMIENSGILEKLLPGDLVLADRCFKLVCVKDKTSDSSSVRCHLKAIPKNAEETKMLTRVRVHVKRIVINIRNKYTILLGQMPPNMTRPCEGEETTLLDRTVALCCVLTNMCPRTVESSSSD